MELRWKQAAPGLADGVFCVAAKGYMAAALHWANEHGPLPDWTAFGYLPLDTAGRGSFVYTGGRAVPPGATHIAARVIASDFEKTAVILQTLPARARMSGPGRGMCFAVMSDLHMTGKCGRIRRAFRLARHADCVLLAGDLTTDATPEQFEQLWRLLDDELPGVPVLAVAGNHDFPLYPLPLIHNGPDDWPAFQTALLERAAALGVCCAEDSCGAWRAALGGVDIFGLRAVSHWRRFVFPHGEALEWLEAQLKQNAAGQRIVLCHAPLLHHNPLRGDAGDAAYLSRDARLQQIMDASENIFFISGHTHISLNEWAGCVEHDRQRHHVYLNDACVAVSTMRTKEALTGSEWTDGAVCFLNIGDAGMEISAQALSSGKWIARGYYHFASSTD